MKFVLSDYLDDRKCLKGGANYMFYKKNIFCPNCGLYKDVNDLRGVEQSILNYIYKIEKMKS